MLSHNETQLDSYNKNPPRAHGNSIFTQVPSSPTGIKKEFIEIIKDRDEHLLKLIFQKNMKNYY